MELCLAAATTALAASPEASSCAWGIAGLHFMRPLVLPDPAHGPAGLHGIMAQGQSQQAVQVACRLVLTTGQLEVGAWTGGAEASEDGYEEQVWAVHARGTLTSATCSASAASSNKEEDGMKAPLARRAARLFVALGLLARTSAAGTGVSGSSASTAGPMACLSPMLDGPTMQDASGYTALPSQLDASFHLGALDEAAGAKVPVRVRQSSHAVLCISLPCSLIISALCT